MAMETIQGTINYIKFQKEDTGWTVALLTDGTTITGVLPGVVPGIDVTLHGEWEDHKTYGQQFHVRAHRTARPSSVEAITIYLQEMVYGIGPELARRITRQFGMLTPSVMGDPRQLTQVSGIGPLKAADIAKSWQAHEAERVILEDLLSFFVQNGLPTGLAHKAFAKWGFEAVTHINANPYILIELEGVGFKRADAIATQVGVPKDAPSRIQAALEYVLGQATMSGHCYLEVSELRRQAGELLGAGAEQIDREISSLSAKERIQVENTAVYSERLWVAEKSAASGLLRLLRATVTRCSAIDTTSLPGGITYTPTQSAAIRAAFTQPVSIITGGPGTGKTTITRAIVELAHGKAVVLCSPTGKASKRLAQATGHPASTIHRTLGIDPRSGGFLHDHHNPLYADLVIIDEASMLDISLARHLLDALPTGAHVVFVGDVDQLPAVGPGNVLRDIIDSGVIPVTRLDTIFRQDEQSFIIPNAHAINRGQLPTYNSGLGGDFYLDQAGDAATAARKVVELVTQRITVAFGYKADSIQVLTPMHRGEAGDDALNQALQAALNPPSGHTGSGHTGEVKIGGHIFRVGDPVIQCRNNYDLGVFNGDQGIVKRIGQNDAGKPAIWIEFDDELHEFKPADLNELRLAYAITVHKSQGSEFPVVVMPVLTQHYVMLQRNLLYTGVTRAKELVVLVGNNKAVAIAVKNDKIARRNTRLAERLK